MQRDTHRTPHSRFCSCVRFHSSTWPSGSRTPVLCAKDTRTRKRHDTPVGLGTPVSGTPKRECRGRRSEPVRNSVGKDRARRTAPYLHVQL